MESSMWSPLSQPVCAWTLTHFLARKWLAAGFGQWEFPEGDQGAEGIPLCRISRILVGGPPHRALGLPAPSGPTIRGDWMSPAPGHGTVLYSYMLPISRAKMSHFLRAHCLIRRPKTFEHSCNKIVPCNYYCFDSTFTLALLQLCQRRVNISRHVKANCLEY